jgi:anti-sigma regulatory factor (Ser/Thr protein kinase)
MGRDGEALEAAEHDGRVVFLDAESVLSCILTDGGPSWERFDRIVGGQVRRLADRSEVTEVRAFGEMVGLLWARGQCTAAMQLEAMWNRLLELCPLRLFCAYPVDVLGAEFAPGTIEPVLSAHTEVLTAGPHVHAALRHAVTEVLGPDTGDAVMAAASTQRVRHTLPDLEATVLWLREHPPADAGEILDRARRHLDRAAGGEVRSHMRWPAGIELARAGAYAEAPPAGTWSEVGRWVLDGASALSTVRRHVMAAAREREVERPSPDAGPSLAAASERLALVCGELAANAIRHGRPPVTVRLARGRQSWLLEVSDNRIDAMPRPRTPSPTAGGMGLPLIAAASDRVGWYVAGSAKHVWAEVADRPPPIVRKLSGAAGNA